MAELCFSCGYNDIHKEADGHCTECDENMCNQCFQEHRKAKWCRDHVLVTTVTSLEGLHVSPETAINMCTKHSRRIIKHYCPNHEEVLCDECIKHHMCRTKLIRDLTTDFKENRSFTDMLRNIQQLQVKVCDILQELSDNRKENKAMQNHILAEIKDFRKKINDYLDNAEEKLLEAMEKVCTDNQNILKEIESEVNTINKEVTCMNERIVAENQKENLFIHMIKCKSNIQTFDMKLKSAEARNVIKGAAFYPAKPVENILARDCGLGKLEISRHSDHKLPDPRAAGFFVGRRVQHFIDFEWRTGRVTNVDCEGYVKVKFSDGTSKRCLAGDMGLYEVKLIPEDVEEEYVKTPRSKTFYH